MVAIENRSILDEQEDNDLQEERECFEAAARAAEKDRQETVNRLEESRREAEARIQSHVEEE